MQAMHSASPCGPPPFRLQVFSGHSGPVTCGGFTPDGKHVVTGGGEGDASLRLWNPKTGECLLTVAGHHYHTAGLTCLAVNPDSTTAVTGSEDGSAKVVNLANGRVMATLGSVSLTPGGPAEEADKEEAGVEAVAFSSALPGVALTGALDGALVAWDMASAAPRATCTHPDVSWAGMLDALGDLKLHREAGWVCY